MAKIDTSKIEGYDKMTPEQKLAALEGFEYEDNAAEVERLKNANSKANSEAAEWKRKHNALLTEDEKKKQEDADALANMQKELEALKAQLALEEEKRKTLEMQRELEALKAANAKQAESAAVSDAPANDEGDSKGENPSDT